MSPYQKKKKKKITQSSHVTIRFLSVECQYLRKTSALVLRFVYGNCCDKKSCQTQCKYDRSCRIFWFQANKVLSYLLPPSQTLCPRKAEKMVLVFKWESTIELLLDFPKKNQEMFMFSGWLILCVVQACESQLQFRL